MRLYTKAEAYKYGYYSFPAPPVNTHLWTKKNWINYIDNNGNWTVRVED